MPRQAARTERSRPKLSRDGFQQVFDDLVDNIGQVIKGKEDVIRLTLVAMLANGHVLLEDNPGTGKTMLARALAQSIDAKVSRLQCTPDLLPGDITGSSVLERKTGDFVFRPGPIFANVFLCDEVNRATPKTQSSLLEAMAERTVTYDGVTHALPSPFFVLATENPVELAGTFPLPEAQLDRFLFKLSVGYPDREAEVDVLSGNAKTDAIATLGPVVDSDTVLALIDWAGDVTVSEPIKYYITDLVQATRSDPALQMGASPRASLALLRTAKVMAASLGRDDVVPDDVKALAKPVLAHRLLLSSDALLREETVENVVERVVTRTRVPMDLPTKAPRRSRRSGPEAVSA